MNPGAFFRIIRPLNAMMAGFAGILAYVIATGTVISSVGIIFSMVFLITAAGNVINDYFDASIDAINRPDRPIPSGEIAREHALFYAILLFIIGNLIGIFSAPFPLIAIAIVNSILLWLYASHLKTMPLLGNVAVSYLSASIFLFGGALEGWTGIIANLPVAGATFSVMLSRELIKDAEDMPGDIAQGAQTFPIRYGIRTTVMIATLSAIIGILVTISLYFRWGAAYLLGIIPVNVIILLGAKRALRCRNSEEITLSRSSTILKAGMFVSLLVFLIAAVLFRI